MSAAQRTIRALTDPEVATLVGWAAGEGWNPGLHDAAAFHAADPAGFLGAFVGGELAAGISAVAYGEAFGFIGLYICRPDLRGRGHGRAVWDAAMARLAGRTIGLDGVPQQQANYSRMGFAAAYRTVRYSGRLEGAGGGRIRPVDPGLAADIVACDRRFFPAPRAAFLERWLRPPHVALAAMRGTSLAGYGVARPCRDGWKIGPLFAETDADAQHLLAALSAAAGGLVHLDVPATAGAFSAFLLASGFTAGFETARMYHGPAPTTARQGHAITTLELG